MQNPPFYEESLKDSSPAVNPFDPKSQKIEELELKLIQTEAKYKLDTENLQNYINLLRKKLKTNKLSFDSSVKRAGFTQSTSKAELDLKTEKSSSHHLYSKLQALSNDKNRLELALSEAEKDLKRLYQEIKSQSEIIAGYKEKLSNSYVSSIEQKNKVLENQVKVEEIKLKENEDENKKIREEMEGLKQEIKYLQEKIMFYDDSDIPREVKKYENLRKGEKLLEIAKVECKEMIFKFSKEINEKYSEIVLRTQKLEFEEGKIHHLFKILQNKINTSGMANVTKLKKDLEIAKKELEEALRENYDLHETLEHINQVNAEKQEQLMIENEKLKNMIKVVQERRRHN
jgi:chromosome segregation ATPase